MAVADGNGLPLATTVHSASPAEVKLAPTVFRSIPSKRRPRRYKRRWKIERVFAWLGNFRRVVVRWEYKVQNFRGFVALGCIVMLLRNL